MKQILGHGSCPLFRVVCRFIALFVVLTNGSTTMALALVVPFSRHLRLRPRLPSVQHDSQGRKAIHTTARQHRFPLSSLSTFIDDASTPATPRRWADRPNHNHQRFPIMTTKSTTALYGSRRLSMDASHFDKNNDDDDEMLAQYYARPVVQWYPGHIAKAERQLREVLKAVDVVIEVRHARAMEATSHPMVTSWCAGRPRIVAVTHADHIPSSSQQAWKSFYENQRKNIINNNNSINEPTAGENHSNKQVPIVDRQVQNQAKQAIQERLKYQSDGANTAAASSATTNDQQQRQQLLSLDIPDAVLFVNAKTGSGIPALIRTIFKAGEHVQVRRARRGLQPRPLRVGIMGFPNVGKSALINRLLGRKRAKTANTPGVTRSLQWIRVRQPDTNSASGSAATAESSSSSSSFELLDSPGIIPAVLDNQDHATLLAVCNCIGNAAYDNQGVATFLCQYLLDRHRQHYAEYTNDNNSSSGSRRGPPKRAHRNAISGKSAPPPPEAPEWRQKCMDRYKFDPLEWVISPRDGVTKVPRTGADILYTVADNTCQGDPEDAARKILQDFRTGRMGPICLQLPWTERLEQQVSRSSVTEPLKSIGDSSTKDEKQEERTRITIELAQERGIELPPSIWHTEVDSPAAAKKDMASSSSPTEIGKGLFDGW